jgi:hypothetical protein
MNRGKEGVNEQREGGSEEWWRIEHREEVNRGLEGVNKVNM